MKFDIYRLRKKLNLSQKELADKLGIRQSFLSAIETGKSPLPPDKRRRLSELCAPESIEEYIIDKKGTANSTDHNTTRADIVSETNMFKELLNYFHNQAHRNQDEHHEMMHHQMDNLQERNEKLLHKNDMLQEKVERLNTVIDELRENLHAVRTENLKLKEKLISHGISVDIKL